MQSPSFRNRAKKNRSASISKEKFLPLGFVHPSFKWIGVDIRCFREMLHDFLSEWKKLSGHNLSGQLPL